jgi:hypothetical protein
VSLTSISSLAALTIQGGATLRERYLVDRVPFPDFRGPTPQNRGDDSRVGPFISRRLSNFSLVLSIVSYLSF